MGDESISNKLTYLLIGGGIDEQYLPALPEARSQLIPGAAHDPQVTHPGVYSAAIEGFASRREAEV